MNICTIRSKKCVYHERQTPTSMVSNGPPALSGWNWAPQTFFPESTVDLMPSTEESLQLMKKGSHPAGNGSVNFSAYWWFWLEENFPISQSDPCNDQFQQCSPRHINTTSFDGAGGS